MLALSLNIIAMIYVENMVMVTLTKLFVISIVANSLLGFCLISSTAFSDFRLDVFSSLMSLGCKENSAVSLADAIAEQKSKMHNINKYRAVCHVNPLKNISSLMFNRNIQVVVNVDKIYDLKFPQRYK